MNLTKFSVSNLRKTTYSRVIWEHMVLPQRQCPTFSKTSLKRRCPWLCLRGLVDAYFTGHCFYFIRIKKYGVILPSRERAVSAETVWEVGKSIQSSAYKLEFFVQFYIISFQWQLHVQYTDNFMYTREEVSVNCRYYLSAPYFPYFSTFAENEETWL